MKKMKLWTILLLSLALTCSFVGCKKNESAETKETTQAITENTNVTDNKKESENNISVQNTDKQTEQENTTTEETDNVISAPETSNKTADSNSAATESSKKQPIQQTSETQEQKETQKSQETSSNSSNNKTTSSQTHTHNWIAQTETIYHEEVGHWETVVDPEWEKDHYAWRTFCNKCGEDITNLGAEGITVHSAIICESGYHNDYVQIKPIEDTAVTKKVWVVDTPASSETVVTEYKCDCGATKTK